VSLISLPSEMEHKNTKIRIHYSLCAPNAMDFNPRLTHGAMRADEMRKIG